jgi:hypothetical protein
LAWGHFGGVDLSRLIGEERSQFLGRVDFAALSVKLQSC